MSMFEGIVIAVVVILAVIMLRYYIKSKNGFGRFFVGVLSGIGGLIAVSTLFPQYFCLNILSICIAGVLGLPGVALLFGIGVL